MSERKLPPIEARALRTKEAGTFERLLCQLLIRANASEGLKKIELMCQAYHRAKSMLPQNPGTINEDEVETIHKCVTALSNEVPHPIYDPYITGRKCYHVMWPFDPLPENYERFIKPWRKTRTGFTYYPCVLPVPTTQDVIDNISKKHNDYLDSIEEWARFFCITEGMLNTGGFLTESAFHNLCNQFLVWAMPKVDEWYVELTKLVDSSVFDDMFRTMYGGEKKPEKEE